MRKQLVVGPSEAGLRFDQAVAALTGMSRRRARALIGEGEVHFNGQPRRNQSRPVVAGDVVEIAADQPGPEAISTSSAAGTEDGVTILYEDDSLLAVDKPAGVLSQPAERRREGDTAMDERLLMALAARDGRRPFLRLVHRLDRVTSGLLLFARSPDALAPLAEAWRAGRVDRSYLAVVEGVPEADRQWVEAPIARAPGGGWRFEVSGLGKPAATEVAKLHQADGFTLVECRLETGRTHQVRVHLAHLGHPVAGDRLYGARHDPAGRPLLHAARLRLPHPRTGRPLELRSKPPAAFADYLPRQLS